MTLYFGRTRVYNIGEDGDFVSIVDIYNILLGNDLSCNASVYRLLSFLVYL